MSTQKVNIVEMASSAEVSDVLEKFDVNVIDKYQELNNKCDVIIKKIKSRKSKKKS